MHKLISSRKYNENYSVWDMEVLKWEWKEKGGGGEGFGCGKILHLLYFLLVNIPPQKISSAPA